MRVTSASVATVTLCIGSPISTPVTRSSSVNRTPISRAFSPERVLQPAAVDLVRVQHRETRRSELGALGDVAVVALSGEEPQPHLRQLLRLHVLLEPEDLAEVARRHRHGRLADLVRRLGHRVLLLLDDRDVRVGVRELELAGKRQPADAAAHDQYLGLLCVAHGVLLVKVKMR